MRTAAATMPPWLRGDRDSGAAAFPGEHLLVRPRVPRPRSLDMLRRYESGWRSGVLADPSPEEWEFIRELVQRYGSYLDVPA